MPCASIPISFPAPFAHSLSLGSLRLRVVAVCRAQDGNGWVSFDEYCAWIARYRFLFFFCIGNSRFFPQKCFVLYSLHYEEPELSAEDQDFLQGGMMTM